MESFLALFQQEWPFLSAKTTATATTYYYSENWNSCQTILFWTTTMTTLLFLALFSFAWQAQAGKATSTPTNSGGGGGGGVWAFSTWTTNLRRRRRHDHDRGSDNDHRPVLLDTASTKATTAFRDSLQWWDDLAPPFAFRDDDDDHNDDNGDDEVSVNSILHHHNVAEEEKDDNNVNENNSNSGKKKADSVRIIQGTGISAASSFASSTSSSSSNNNNIDARKEMTHFCFLVHGHRGLSKDLSYLQTVMRRRANLRRRERVRLSSTAAAAAKNKPLLQRHDDMVVHAAVCNERKTDDGVCAGGDRLVEEIRNVIHHEMKVRSKQRNHSNLKKQKQQEQQEGQEQPHDAYTDITISFLGNSLGGLYSRYAAAKLTEECTRDDTGHWVLDGTYRLHFNIFMTTATPHLGVAGHTFFPLPRTAEIGVAHALGATGRDLFRLNGLLKEMATTPKFLHPLAAFAKRIAYANAFGTDFVVPAQTAAFLNEASNYPHQFAKKSTTDGDSSSSSSHKHGSAASLGNINEEMDDLVIATVYTPAHTMEASRLAEYCLLPSNKASGAGTADGNVGNVTDEENLAFMTVCLDALGWKKVFVDSRANMPKIAIPKTFTSGLGFSFSSEDGSSSSLGSDASWETGEEDRGEESNINTEQRIKAIARLREKGIVSSREVAQAMHPKTPLLSDHDEDQHHLVWPMGHNMIVAFSRNRLSTYMNKAGRPVVDALARQLVDDIFAWTPAPTGVDHQESAAADVAAESLVTK